jgi:branched-chain amino acid aminotransferase
MAFTGTGKVWMNGSLVDWADAKIHIASHVIHYGSAVFEGARCYDTPRGSACFQLDAHMRRLYDSAKIYRMEPQVDRQTMTAAVLETIRENKFKACYIRPIVYRGYNTLGVDPSACPVDSAILPGSGARIWGKRRSNAARTWPSARGRVPPRTRFPRSPRAQPTTPTPN